MPARLWWDTKKRLMAEPRSVHTAVTFNQRPKTLLWSPVVSFATVLISFTKWYHVSEKSFSRFWKGMCRPLNCLPSCFKSVWGDWRSHFSLKKKKKMKRLTALFSSARRGRERCRQVRTAIRRLSIQRRFSSVRARLRGIHPWAARHAVWWAAREVSRFFFSYSYNLFHTLIYSFWPGV
jgi:hypothetical protein